MKLQIFIFIIISLISNVLSSEQKILSSLGCQLSQDCAKLKLIENESKEQNVRIIAIGDIHGSYVGLLENLFDANITTSIDICHWRLQDTKTILVQTGDLVDRGPGAIEALDCLKSLQDTAEQYNGQVVRLFGNHDYWWLQDYLKYKHKADTPKKIEKFVKVVKEDILNGKIVGAYFYPLLGIPIIFNHAGFSNDFLKTMKLSTPTQIVNATNEDLIKTIRKCENKVCKFKSKFYEAGPERGGYGVGGPYWNDYSVLQKQGKKTPYENTFIQVVGHSIADCFLTHDDPKTLSDCPNGLIRPAKDLSAFCVDAGMYAGGRGFLHITKDGHFITYEKYGGQKKITDYTHKVCSKACSVNEL